MQQKKQIKLIPSFNVHLEAQPKCMAKVQFISQGQNKCQNHNNDLLKRKQKCTTSVHFYFVRKSVNLVVVVVVFTQNQCRKLS